MNKKGFSLVELIAIITILAIIAMIATPIMFNVIKDSQLSAFKTSINGVKKAVEQDYGDNNFKTSTIYYYGGFNGSNYNVDSSTKKLVAQEEDGSTREVKMSGSIEGKGKAQIVSSDGTIEIVMFTKNYCGILVDGEDIQTKRFSDAFTVSDCMTAFNNKGF